MNNPDSLRKQLIDAMTARLGAPMAESVFQHDLWPVLQAAMKAGELLVARNTEPQIPVHRAVEGWLEGVLNVCTTVKLDEHVISKRQLLNIMADLERIGRQALADAKAIEPGPVATRH